MTLQLKAVALFDPEQEAHYSFRRIQAGPARPNRISTVLHTHDFFEIFLITRGRIWHLINEQQILLSTGALVFIRPHDQHCFRQNKSEDGSLINLAFPAVSIQDLFTYLGPGFQADRLLSPALPPMTTLTDAEKETCLHALRKLHEIPRRKSRLIRTQLRILLADWMVRYFSRSLDEEGLVDQHWIHELCVQMQDPANLRLGISRMQELAYTSKEHLSRSFRQEMGITPTQYLTSMRLKYARNLLLHTDKSIAEIGSDVGLENISYFYRVFKRQFGTTPARYRSENRKHPIP